MSGPVEHFEHTDSLGASTIEVKEGRKTSIGRVAIARVLPTKQRRAIGPWCFADLITPQDIAAPPPIEIGPHPHIGLATVTWLLSGSVLHTDSLGSQQPIRPGELNLMTAGGGVAHAEEGLEVRAVAANGGVMGVQMWLAQPEATRHSAGRFEHYGALPVVDGSWGSAQVFVGEFGGVISPATVDSPALGIDVRVQHRMVLRLDAAFEHALIPVDRPLSVDDVIVEPGSLAYLAPGPEQAIVRTHDGWGRYLLLGGRPLGEPITMWWNFVARTKEEITDAWMDWRARNEERFGPVPTALSPIDAPTPPWISSS